jgi:hypothetical protein
VSFSVRVLIVCVLFNQTKKGTTLDEEVAIAALALLAAAPALSQNVKPENQIKFRRAAYTIMNLNFEQPRCDGREQEALQQGRGRPQRGHRPSSHRSRSPISGRTDKDTRAKPEI